MLEMTYQAHTLSQSTLLKAVGLETEKLRRHLITQNMDFRAPLWIVFRINEEDKGNSSRSE